MLGVASLLAQGDVMRFRIAAHIHDTTTSTIFSGSRGLLSRSSRRSVHTITSRIRREPGCRGGTSRLIRFIDQSSPRACCVSRKVPIYLRVWRAFSQHGSFIRSRSSLFLFFFSPRRAGIIAALLLLFFFSLPAVRKLAGRAVLLRVMTYLSSTGWCYD